MKTAEPNQSPHAAGPHADQNGYDDHVLIVVCELSAR
jgi:hypothetical protein